MEKKIDLTIDAIYKEKFEKDVKGYNAEQVDIFLDRIIRDYDTFSEIISSKDAQIASLKAELSKTKEQIANADVDYDGILRTRKISVIFNELMLSRVFYSTKATTWKPLKNEAINFPAQANAGLTRGKSMLAHPVMDVVIALGQSINLGTPGVRDGVRKVSLRWFSPRCHRDELVGDNKVKRGKPHKRETQIW